MADPFTVTLAQLAQAGVEASKTATSEAAGAKLLVAGLIKTRRAAFRMMHRKLARQSEVRRTERGVRKRSAARAIRKLRTASVR